jgi:tetratricopeptide (TPR) repeat protein
MKRMACGVLVLMVCGTSGWGQRRVERVEDVGATPRQSPMATDSTRLQWLLLSGSVGSPMPARAAAANAAGVPGGTVSVEALKVPNAAIKEMQKFFKDFKAGKLEDSVKHAAKAIEIYPQWSTAHHNLGQTYARMGDYDKAIVAFQNAAELDTREVQSWLGMSKVYFLQKKYAEGEAAARRALDIDPVNSDAKYFLGRNLVSNGQDTPEAMELLKKSKEQYAAARLVLANVYLKHGAVNDAVGELRGYIAQPDAPSKERVECLVRKLTEPEGAVSCEMR